MMKRHIAVIAFEGISPFHLSVPSVVFGEDRSMDGIPQYDVTVCSLESRPIKTSAGYSIVAESGLEALRPSDTVIVPSWRVFDNPPENLIEAINEAHRRGAVIVGLCLGTFVLAAAGLLDGRRATTHWRYAAELAQRYPRVQVDPNVLWVDDGDVVTSAGTAAGIDCCLHLMRKDCGAQVANRVARRLVIAPHRSGDQAQFIERPIEHERTTTPIGDVMAWMRTNLDLPLTVDSLAARANYSRRHFTREFRAISGYSPVQWLLFERLRLAQELLETTMISVDEIAERCGFGSGTSLRRHFQNSFHISPRDYRRQFAHN